MKKYLLGLTALALAALMLLAPGCSAQNAPGSSSPEPSSGAVLSAEIVGSFGETLLLCAPDGDYEGLYTVNPSKLAVLGEDGKELSPEELAPGMTVDVAFDGEVLAIWPALLSNPSQLRVTGRSNGVTSFYFQVIKDLIREDPGLNDGIEFVSLDLTEAGPLTAHQREALVYLTACELGCEGLQLTFEQLREEGYIPEDDLIFENGLLFTITLASESFQPSGFSFSASKWRSGEGAYYLNDCSASPSGSGWSYTVGSFAIA